MKFSLKLLLCTVIVLAIALGFSGFYFVNYVFDTSLGREVGQAVDENSILCFAFETAALNVPAKYDVLQDHTVEQIASNLEAGGLSGNRMLRLSDEEKNKLYASDGFETDDSLLMQTDVTTKTYRTIFMNDHYYIQTGSTVNALDRVLYLETLRDVSEVFNERELGFRVFRQVTVIMLILGTVTMHLIASWLTKPIRLLTRATKRMAAGDYDYRARQVSNDELGQLTLDFNHMAEALEENINKLEDEIQAKEDFVGAFAHELKTPLTSIIGYGDMLRSMNLSEEEKRSSSDYIYKQGKRLERLSYKMMELVRVDKQGITLKPIKARELAYEIERFTKRLLWEKKVVLEKTVAPGIVWGDMDLLCSLFGNLIDNASKACGRTKYEEGEQGKILLTGKQEKKGYSFTVEDNGCGIPAEEVGRITEAFYMVDKSRARKEGGAGIGMTLCSRIVGLHHAFWKIDSKEGVGTSVYVFFPEEEEEDD